MFVYLLFSNIVVIILIYYIIIIVGTEIVDNWHILFVKKWLP